MEVRQAFRDPAKPSRMDGDYRIRILRPGIENIHSCFSLWEFSYSYSGNTHHDGWELIDKYMVVVVLSQFRDPKKTRDWEWDVIQENSQTGIRFPRYLRHSENIDCVVHLLPRTQVGISREESALRIIRHTAEDINFKPMLNKEISNIVNPECFWPKMLSNNQYSRRGFVRFFLGSSTHETRIPVRLFTAHTLSPG